MYVIENLKPHEIYVSIPGTRESERTRKILHSSGEVIEEVLVSKIDYAEETVVLPRTQDYQKPAKIEISDKHAKALREDASFKVMLDSNQVRLYKKA